MKSYAARVDTTQKAIVKALRKFGASVMVIQGAPGTPDLVVGYRGINYLMEVKAKDGKLKPAQIEFFETWSGRVCLVRNEEEAVAALRTPTVAWGIK